MSSRSGYERLLIKGHSANENPYHQLDGLEKIEDVENLQALLESHQDYLGKYACMTMNYLSANPDFRKIHNSKFKKYYRQALHDTYIEYDGNMETINKVKDGERLGVFDVQFHGTEHLQINRWMEALREGNKRVREAFDERVFSPSVSKDTGYTMEYMDALDYDSIEEVPAQIDNLNIGLELFKQVWGRSPLSFIAPCYRWSKPIERYLSSQGIKYIQGQRAQLHPKDVKGYRQKKIYHYTGQQNECGQIYTVRNVTFEPSLFGSKKSLEMAQQQIANAFRFDQPAVISSHRINYTSRLLLENRDRGLRTLNDLLKWILKSYPDVEFLSSVDLGKRIENIKS